MERSKHFVPACRVCALHQTIGSKGSGGGGAALFILGLFTAFTLSMAVGEGTSILLGFVTFGMLTLAIVWLFKRYDTRQIAKAAPLLKDTCSGTVVVAFMRTHASSELKTDIFKFDNIAFARAFSILNNGKLELKR